MDHFKEIHALQKSGNSNIAISMLLDRKTGKIKSPYKSDLNHAWYTVGDIFYKNEKYLEALSAFKKAYKNWTDDVQSLWAIANCYSQLGRPKLAKYYLLKSLRVGKRTDELSYNLGNSYYDLRQYSQAIQQYSQVKKTNSKVYKMAMNNKEKAKRQM